MKKITGLFVCSLLLCVAGCKSLTPAEKEAKRQQEVTTQKAVEKQVALDALEKKERQADRIISSGLDQHSTFVFDPTTHGCYMYYYNEAMGDARSAIASLSYLPCDIARPRLTPKGLAALEKYEAALKAGKSETEPGR